MKLDLSVVIPVYNEEKNVKILYNHLIKILDSIKLSSEIIFVDDGSTDNTTSILRQLAAKDKGLVVLSFQKNFQKAAALTAGFDCARGQYILTMDGDLQDNPDEIPRFLHKIKSGYDMIVGWKARRKDPFTKVIMSKLFNGLIRLLFHIKIHDNDCNFRLFRSQITQHLHIYGGLYRYIPVIAYAKGFKIGELKVHHLHRRYGKSKYGYKRIFRGGLDLITIKFLTSYYSSPLHFFGYLGGGISFIGLVLGIYLTILQQIYHQAIGNRPLLFLSMLLIIVGIQLISLGLIGEMIVSTTNKKNYVIKEKIN